MKKIKYFLWFVILLVVFTVVFPNLWVVTSTSNLLVNNSDSLEGYEVGIVLGTSDKLVNGDTNPFFEKRIKTATSLYKKGAIKQIIVSGDNRTKYYNEPVKMRDALIANGVPSTVITLDYAGLRTLDSMIRCKEVFGQNKVVVISQQFHCYRAIFIGKYWGMDVVGFPTEAVGNKSYIGVMIRELLARPKAIWDTYIMENRPASLETKN